MYQNGLSAAVFAERAAETAYRGYMILTGFQTVSQAPGNSLQSADYPDTLSQQRFGAFLEFMLSTIERENGLQREESRAF